MVETIDIEKEIEIYLKNLSDTNDSERLESNEKPFEPDNKDEQNELTRDQTSDSSNVIRSAAEKAANMKVDIKGVDLMKQRQDKLKRVDNAIDNRRQALQNDEPDMMKFTN
jgi:hypothetical protein